MHHKKRFHFMLPLLLLLTLMGGACNNSSSDCPLPYPFCGGSFPLNTQETTPYGPPWANVVESASDWITCFGPYALCFYAECTSNSIYKGELVNCPCFETFGTNFVDINAILNEDVYNETKTFCENDPEACHIPNQAPVCASLNSGSFMQGADLFSTFSFYRAAQEPIGSTDCTSQPQTYAGCMTAPCFGSGKPGTEAGTTMIECLCPTYDGPFQLGKDNLSCDDSPYIDSAAYNLITPPTSSGDACSRLDSCVPDAPPENCGCGLYEPGVTALPANSGIDCALVCQQYDTCERAADNIQLGYTCDATLCTSDDQTLIADACLGLQNCDLSEIFKAESAANCSCCASQLCGCSPSTVTKAKITSLNASQTSQGTQTQCEINGTLCGL